MGLLALLALALAGCGQSVSLHLAAVAHPELASRATSSSWSAPETIPASHLDSATEDPTLLAIDGEGAAVVVWSEKTTSAFSLRAAAREAAGPWRAPSNLPGMGIDPQLAIDARGEAIATWQTGTPPYDARAAIRGAGGSWLAPQDLATTAGGQPHVASDARGDSIVVWSRGLSSPAGGIRGAVRPAGGPFGAAQAISIHENARDPRIAMDARGDAFVVWTVDSPRGCVVRGAFRPADGGWGRPHSLSDFHAGCPAEAQLAIDPQGEAIVVWSAARATNDFVEAAGRTGGGRWVPRHALARGLTASSAVVKLDAKGDAIAVWSEWVGQATAIEARVRRAGHGWEPAHRIPHASDGPASLAMDARGNSLIAWTGRGSRIELAARAPGGRWQRAAIRVGREPSDIRPLAALDAHGDGLIAWQDQAGIETSWHPSLFP